MSRSESRAAKGRKPGPFRGDYVRSAGIELKKFAKTDRIYLIWSDTFRDPYMSAAEAKRLATWLRKAARYLEGT